MRLTRGTTVDGPYEIQETFGGGGMGLIYHARHLTWDIDVAIKRLRPDFLKSRRQADEFLSECATWALLGLNPFVATCYYRRELQGLPSFVNVMFCCRTSRITSLLSTTPPKLTISRLARIQGVAESLGWRSTAKPPRPHSSSPQTTAPPASFLLTDHSALFSPLCHHPIANPALSHQRETAQINPPARSLLSSSVIHHLSV